MSYKVTVQTARPITLAAVRATVPAAGIASAWKPALDQVWAFLRTHPVPHAGLNVFLYHHPEHSGEPMNIDFGVQVPDRFGDEGEITCVATPSGQIAQTVHIGPYHLLGEAHAAVRQWCKDHQRPIAASSWEVYGHWNNDPQKLETTVCYLLA